MAIADTLNRYLKEQNIPYDIVAHSPTPSSMRTAEAAQIPGDRLAKTVMLEDERGYLAVVLPATRYVNLPAVNRELHRDLHFANEDELKPLFADCAPGAVPAAGPAYGIETLVDDSLDDVPDVYFEAGDHEALVHVRTEDFHKLLHNARHGHYSRHA